MGTAEGGGPVWEGAERRVWSGAGASAALLQLCAVPLNSGESRVGSGVAGGESAESFRDNTMQHEK